MMATLCALVVPLAPVAPRTVTVSPAVMSLGAAAAVRVMVVLGSRVTVTVAPVLVVSWIVLPCTDATVPLRPPPAPAPPAALPVPPPPPRPAPPAGMAPAVAAAGFSVGWREAPAPTPKATPRPTGRAGSGARARPPFG